MFTLLLAVIVGVPVAIWLKPWRQEPPSRRCVQRARNDEPRMHIVSVPIDPANPKATVRIRTESDNAQCDNCGWWSSDVQYRANDQLMCDDCWARSTEPWGA